MLNPSKYDNVLPGKSKAKESIKRQQKKFASTFAVDEAHPLHSLFYHSFCKKS